MKQGFDPEALAYIERELPDPKQRELFFQINDSLGGMRSEDRARLQEVSVGVDLGYIDPKAAEGLASGRMGLFAPNMPPESHSILKRKNHESGLEYPLEDELKVVNQEIADILKLPKDLLNANNFNTVTLAQINNTFSKEKMLSAFAKIFEKDQKNLKRYANSPDKLKHTNTYLLIYILIRIINTYYCLLMLNPELLSIAKTFQETFLEIQKAISKAQLKQTILHDLVSGFIVTLDLSIVNHQIAKAKRTNDALQRKYMILEAASHAQLGAQRARSMQGNMLKDSYFAKRSNYDFGFLCALIEGELCLDHYSMAKKHIEDLYQGIKSRKTHTFSLYEHIFILYLDKLATLELSDSVLQQRLLWSLRIAPVLEPTKINFKQTKSKLTAEINSLFATFKLRLNDLLRDFPTFKYDAKANTLEHTFAQAVPNDAIVKLEKAFKSSFPKLLFSMEGNNKLVLKNVTSIRLDKLSFILNDSFVKYVHLGEVAIKRALKKELKKEQNAQKKLQDRDKSKTALAHQRAPMQTDDSSTVDATALGLEKLTLSATPHLSAQKTSPKEPPLRSATKPKQNAQPVMASVVKMPIEAPKNTGEALGLENEAYHKLHFKKLENATGILVGFENEFTIGRGNPSKELMQRFREMICKEPKRVPPQNKNGFKWMESEGKVLLVGKIKVEKYRLLPIYSEVTKEGKTVFVYGKISNTKSGKK